MNDLPERSCSTAPVRQLYFISGLVLPLAAFAVPLIRPISPTAQLALFFVASVLSGLVPAIGSRPANGFRIPDPLFLFLGFCALLGGLYLAEPFILNLLGENLSMDPKEFRNVYWLQAIPFCLGILFLVHGIVAVGLVIGVKRGRFIIRKAAAHENMALRLQEVRERTDRPSGLSDFFYKKLMSRCLVFLGERYDLIHYAISALTLSHRDAVFFFDFLDAREDQSRWPRVITAEQFLHNLWQTDVFRGKNLFYIQRPSEPDFPSFMAEEDESRPLADSAASEILGELNARYPLLEVSIPSAREIPTTFESDCKILELLPAPEHRDHGQI